MVGHWGLRQLSEQEREDLSGIAGGRWEMGCKWVA